MLCGRTSLLIHPIYASLHLLIPNSQSVPPWLPFPAANSLFFISVSLFLFHRHVHLCCILESMYKWYHMVTVFLFLTYFTQSDNLQVHLCCCRWRYCIHFDGWVIFRCIYGPHLYPGICCWCLGCSHVLVIVLLLTERCMYLFKLQFFLGVCPGVGFLALLATLFSV